MKWKTAITAEEAALLITDLSEYSSIAFIKDYLVPTEIGPYDMGWDAITRLSEAESLRDVLWDEITHAWSDA